MSTRGEVGLLACGVLLGVIIAVGPGACVADARWCEGYAAGSGHECARIDGACKCADEFTPASGETT